MNNRKSIIVVALLIGVSVIAIIQVVHYLTTSPKYNIRDEQAYFNSSSILDSLMGKTSQESRTPPPGQYEFAKKIPTREDILHDRNIFQAVQWDQRGPSNIGGRTRALAVDVTDENVIFAGGVSGGLWRSSDKGESWIKITRPDQNQFITYIVQDTRPGKKHIWYYGTGERTGSASLIGTGDGLYKSTNGGLSFEVLPSTSFNDPQNYGNGFNWCWKIDINEANLVDDEIWVAADGFIYKSYDGGETWTIVFDGAYMDPVYGYREVVNAPTDIVITPDEIYYVTIAKPFVADTEAQGIWRSTDGNNWVDIRSVPWYSKFGRIVMEVNPQNEDMIYFWISDASLEYSNSLWRYNYLSGDGSGAGGQWELLPDHIQANSQRGYNMLLKVKPDDPNIIYLGGRRLYRSDDAFSSELFTTFFPHADFHNMIYSPHNFEEVIFATDGGVYSAFDSDVAHGHEFNDLNNGYVTTQFYCIGIDHATPSSDYVIGGTQDWGMWFTNSGLFDAAWQLAGGGDVTACAIADGGLYYYFYGAHGIGLYKGSITPSGEITLNVTKIQHTNALSYARIFILDPLNSNMIYFAAMKESEFNSGNMYHYIWRYDGLVNEEYSDDKWSVIEDSRIDGIINGLGVSTYSPSHRVYFGDNQANLYRIDNADSENPIFVELTTPDVELSPNHPIQDLIDIAVDPLNGNKVLLSYMGFEQKSIFYSHDAGITWTHVSGNLEEIPDGSGNGPAIQAVAILPLDETKTIYFSGGSTGLYSTVDLNGEQTIWIQEGMENLGFAPVYDIQVRHSDYYVVVGTHGCGIYSTYIDPNIVSADIEDELPTQIHLAQNYPNPFNPITTIKYQITELSFVTLKVYDELANEIAILVDEEKPAGNYTVELDATGFPSGIYFYRLQTDSYIKTKKMVLIK